MKSNVLNQRNLLSHPFLFKTGYPPVPVPFLGPAQTTLSRCPMPLRSALPTINLESVEMGGDQYMKEVVPKGKPIERAQAIIDVRALIESAESWTEVSNLADEMSDKMEKDRWLAPAMLERLAQLAQEVESAADMRGVKLTTERLLDTLTTNAERYKIPMMLNAFKAVAGIGHITPLAKKIFLAFVQERLFGAQDVVLSLGYISTLAIPVPDDLMAKILERISKGLRAITPDEVASVACSLSQVSNKIPKTFVSRMASVSTQLLATLDADSLAEVANFLIRQGADLSPNWRTNFGDALQQYDWLERGTQSPRSLPRLLFACTRMSLALTEDVLAAMLQSDQSIEQLEELTGEELSVLAACVGIYGFQPTPEWTERYIECVTAATSSVDGRTAAALVSALADLPSLASSAGATGDKSQGKLPEDLANLLDVLLAVAEGSLPEFDATRLHQLARSVGYLGHDVDEIWVAALREVASAMVATAPDAYTVVMMAEAVGAVGKPEKDWADAFASKVTDKIKELGGVVASDVGVVTGGLQAAGANVSDLSILVSDEVSEAWGDPLQKQVDWQQGEPDLELGSGGQVWQETSRPDKERKVKKQSNNDWYMPEEDSAFDNNFAESSVPVTTGPETQYKSGRGANIPDDWGDFSWTSEPRSQDWGAGANAASRDVSSGGFVGSTRARRGRQSEQGAAPQRDETQQPLEDDLQAARSRYFGQEDEWDIDMGKKGDGSAGVGGGMNSYKQRSGDGYKRSSDMEGRGRREKYEGGRDWEGDSKQWKESPEGDWGENAAFKTAGRGDGYLEGKESQSSGRRGVAGRQSKSYGSDDFRGQDFGAREGWWEEEAGGEADQGTFAEGYRTESASKVADEVRSSNYRDSRMDQGGWSPAPKQSTFKNQTRNSRKDASMDGWDTSFRNDAAWSKGNRNNAFSSRDFGGREGWLDDEESGGNGAGLSFDGAGLGNASYLGNDLDLGDDDTVGTTDWASPRSSGGRAQASRGPLGDDSWLEVSGNIGGNSRVNKMEGRPVSSSGPAASTNSKATNLGTSRSSFGAKVVDGNWWEDMEDEEEKPVRRGTRKERRDERQRAAEHGSSTTLATGGWGEVEPEGIVDKAMKPMDGKDPETPKTSLDSSRESVGTGESAGTPGQDLLSNGFIASTRRNSRRQQRS